MLSTPMPYREMIRQRSSDASVSASIGAYVVSSASACAASARMTSGVPAGSTSSVASIDDRIARSTSSVGKTWSVSETSGNPRSLIEHPLVVAVEREDDGPVGCDEHVLLEPHGLLQAGMPGERLDREVHVLLDLGRIVERVRPRHPVPVVQREPDRVGELLERHGAVLVVVVLGELRRDIGGRIPRPEHLEARV